MMKNAFLYLCLILLPVSLYAEDGSALWLRYQKLPENVAEQAVLDITGLLIRGESAVIKAAEEELRMAMAGLTGK